MFLVRIPLASASFFFVSLHYLLNQLMNFGQNCIIARTPRRSRLDFGDLDLQGHGGTLKCPKYGFRALSSEQVDEFLPNLHGYMLGEGKS